MEIRLMLLIIITMNGILTFGQCANESNIYTFSYNGKNYEVVRENKTWSDAASCAVERGGYLAEVNDSTENTAIFNELMSNAGVSVSNTIAPDGGNASYVWIGGSDHVTEGVWIWDGDNDSIGEQFWQGTTTGNQVGGLYNNWGNEPDNWGTGGQDGLGLALTNWPYGVAGQWNDVNAGNDLYFIIEHDSSTSLNELDHSLNISPNPADNVISVTGEGIVQIRILDQNGSVIHVDHQPDPYINTIDISALVKGIYLIRIELEDGRVIIERVVHT